MSNQARNDAELRRMFEKPLKEAVDYIVQKIWNENKELVRQIVYEAYLPQNYNRTGQFQKAWDFDVESSADDEKIAQGAFYYNPNTMSRGSTDPQSSDFGQHISIIDGADMRPYLADIIYNGAYGRAWMNGAGKRDAWDALINSVGKQKMKQWLKEGMQKAGLQGTLHTTPIEVKYSK